MTGIARRPLPEAAHADAETLRDLIVRCRRQARFALFARWGSAACAVGAATAAAVVFLSSRPLPWPWTMAAGGVVVAFGAAAAVWRTPTDLQVAAAIDRRLHLDDCVVAALQVHGSGALVASLVVRHAIRLTRGVDARVVFPLKAGRPAVAVGIAASLLLVTTLAGRFTAQGTASAAGQASSGDTTSGSPTADAGREPAAATRAARGGGAALNGRTGRGAVPRVAPERTGDSRRSPVSSAGAMSRPSGAPTSTSNTPSGQSADLSIGEPRGRGRSGVSGDGGTRDDPGGQGGSGRGTPGTGGQGASSAGRGSGAGGVRGGTLINAGTVVEMNGIGPARTGARYSQAGPGGTAAAMAHDDIPPDLRSYVRDYFAAIAPASEGK